MEKRFKDIQKRARLVFLLTILAVFAILIGLNYLAGTRPSELEACMQSCAPFGRQGELVHKFTAEQTAGMRGRGPTECQCR